MNKNVLNRYFNYQGNESPPIALETNFIEKVFKHYGARGFAIISGVLRDRDAKYNDFHTIRLINELYYNNYKYLPIYGIYTTTTGEEDYHPYFLVFPFYHDSMTLYNRSVTYTEVSVFKEFIQELRENYKQESVLIMGTEKLYINPIATTLNEKLCRAVKGEITLSFLPCWKSKKRRFI